MNTLDALLRDGLPASVLTKPLREVWIAIRTDGAPDVDPSNPVVIGDGTRDNPWDASTAIKLDLVLRSPVFAAQDNTIIHLGAGLFRTGGANGGNVYVKWRPLSGQKIIGAGQFQTTLL